MSVAALSDRVVAAIAENDPVTARLLGLSASGLTDYGPDACEARCELLAGFAEEARSMAVTGDSERIARDVIAQRLTATARLGAAGEHLRDLNILDSPPQRVRTALELLSADARPGAADELLHAVPAALHSWRDSLELGVRRDRTAARRQAVAVSEQLRTLADSWLPDYGRSRSASPDAVAAAVAAYREAAMWLADVYASAARPEDAVGEHDYALAAAFHTGLELDLDDTFEWGFEQIELLADQIRAEARRLDPGESPGGWAGARLRQRLDEDPRYRIEGVPALLAHLEDLTARATAAIDGTVMDLDPRVRHCQVRIAAQGAAAAPYYIPPSEDLSRPGSTWFPTRGRDVFPRWWLTTVWFHEGVPGHHMQLGANAAQADLTRFQRTLGFTSGHAEGWAQYAETLCDELGLFDEPGTRIGYLSASMMRAVRVVVDIGMHTGRTVPDGHPDAGAHVDPRFARRLLTEMALLPDDFAASEIDRYLGLPGQAVTYKVGEREWLAARSDARRRQGPGFDLRRWHNAAIGLGPMGLAQFRAEVAAAAG